MRTLVIAALAISVAGCVVFGGPMDAYQPVEGTLAPTQLSDCYVRFVSSRDNRAHGMGSVKPGPFKIGFIWNPGDKVSDFSAQLSCAGGEWHPVGPSDAFSHGTSAAIMLGEISP